MHMKAASKTVKTWENTRVQNLKRHKSGLYYARLFENGKDVWKPLKTKHFSVAEARIAEAQKEHRQHRKKEVAASSVKMTFQDAADLHSKQLSGRVDIKDSTRHYWKQILTALGKYWPELPASEIRKLTESDCREWATRFAKTASANRYNNSIAFLRHVFDVAIEQGIIHKNPAAKLERKPVRSKILELPSLQQFQAFVESIRGRHGRFSTHCADFTEGLAYTGCRKTEGGRIVWQDLNFKAGEILVKGDPTDRTKNGEVRRIPMIPSARALFERMRLERPDEDPTAPVFKVRECQKSMDRAAETIGMIRITHHDLRHFFATICIESGVDIPTVSRWLGHQDGGILAMKTYGHLRREHSQSQALKVSFKPSEAA
ncbi:site-specific recombinase XerD [Prosthecobacter fusiformis]|uniref:Site-specific recombinase XerD n=2 Tax=Prosthecobacter fusiformis TaxID=48464 RepID=A0A4R7RVX1_9BACT|nr:site-specific recombinase XerD [Prosthecobacter fusiformis]